jgi:uncharacterized protein GlcG (DUF336 family)
MRLRCAVPALLASMLLAGSALAQQAPSGLTAETAQKMAEACVAFAKAHDGAVNIWVYDNNGGMLHFQRMDGAPRPAPFAGSGVAGLDSGYDSNDPAAFTPSAPGAVPVMRDGRNAGTVRAAGMGPISDRACAQAAAAVAARPQGAR